MKGIPKEDLLFYKKMIERGRENALLRCALYGHDYRKVDIDGGEICVCCGCHPKSLKENS